MSVYKAMNRVFVTLQSGDVIPTILSEIEPEARKVPKKNGEPGFYYNQYASGVQLAPDGVTVYPQDNINLAFVKPREEIIDGFDVNPETGEVASTEVAIPGALAFLFNRHSENLAARQANGGGAKNTPVAEAAAEVSE
jgi:hypothetical protein